MTANRIPTEARYVDGIAGVTILRIAPYNDWGSTHRLATIDDVRPRRGARRTTVGEWGSAEVSDYAADLGDALAALAAVEAFEADADDRRAWQ